MIRMTLREHVLQPTAIRRTLLWVFVAGALIVGLLAMHTIAAAGGHSDPLHASMVIDSPHSSMAVETTIADAVGSCDDACGPAHTMAAMTCILALLIGVLLIGASRHPDRWSLTRSATVFMVGQAHGPSARGLPPPDLNILSISRV
jgi:hypothetical protein